MLTPIGRFVQRADPERFVTTLFAPAARREALWALYAFNHELARAREVVSQPMLALIRLQWWREVVEGAARAHEVAGPVRAALDSGLLNPDALLAMIEARELEAEEAVDAAQFQAYMRGAGGALMAEAGRVLGASEAGELARLGAGCAAVGLRRNAAAHASAGRWAAPEHDPAAMIGNVRRWSSAALPAALPAVFARRYLAGRGLGTGALLAVWRASITRRC